MEQWLYKWLPIFFGCHCREDRSFHYHGKKFPVCARCTGELIGMLALVLSCWFCLPSWKIAALLMLPLIVDGFLQMLTPYVSTNLRRLLTGILFGYGFAALLAISWLAVFWYGRRLGERLWK